MTLANQPDDLSVLSNSCRLPFCCSQGRVFSSKKTGFFFLAILCHLLLTRHLRVSIRGEMCFKCLFLHQFPVLVHFAHAIATPLSSSFSIILFDRLRWHGEYSAETIAFCIIFLRFCLFSPACQFLLSFTFVLPQRRQTESHCAASRGKFFLRTLINSRYSLPCDCLPQCACVCVRQVF